MTYIQAPDGFAQSARSLIIAAVVALTSWACQTSQETQTPDLPAKESSAEAPAKETRPDLPDEDLVLWLYPDADRLGTNAGNVYEWKDASGNQNNLMAPGQSMQPSFDTEAVGGAGAVRFDGQDDMLMTDDVSPGQLAAATVFIVAAPATNAGNFDGLISAGTRGAEDSFTGFNVDLGGKNFAGCADSYPDPTSALNTINVQSAKTTVDCGRDLLETSVPFGRASLITARIDNDETTLRLDGRPQQSAGGGPDTLDVGQLRLGVRYHRQKFQGYFDGAIAEVIVYARSLSDAEIDRVESYLSRWYDLGLDS